jgi:hypothetical protein
MLKTATGYAECVGKWRSGGFPTASMGVARIKVQDDVTHSIWKYTGKRRDAAAAIGNAIINGGSRFRNAVARLNGDYLDIETPPDDLSIGKGTPNEDGEFDEFEFNAAKHPDIVAY